MKYRPRIYYTETDKALMWDRRKKVNPYKLSPSFLIAIIHQLQVSCREPGVYVLLNESVLKLHSACQNAKRFLAVLLPVILFIPSQQL